MLHILDLINTHQYDYSDVRPYVFSPDDGIATPVPETDEVLASPFEIFSIEVDGSNLTVDNGKENVNINCIYCHELSFDKYFFIVKSTAKGQTFIYRVYSDKVEAYSGNKLIGEQSTSSMYDHMKTIVSAFLVRLHAGKLGVYNTSGKAKFKTQSGRKSTFKANDIIYVRKKDQVEGVSTKTDNKRAVNWQSTWEVTSHWRRIKDDSLGKDRRGERVVKGATWIKSYSKGMGELKIKVRRVGLGGAL